MAGIAKQAESDRAGTETALAGHAEYPPGPFSRLVGWLDERGWIGWLLCFGLGLALAAWSHAVLWSSGSLEPGTPDLPTFALIPYPTWALLGAITGLHVARRALSTFWPATGWPHHEQGSWAYRFAYAPVRLELAASAVGLVVGLASLVAAPVEVLGPEPTRASRYLAYAPTFALGYGLAGAVVAVAVRWLWLVSRIHRDARAIDPFDRAPIYAFSRLTVYIGLGYLLATYYTLTVNAPNQSTPSLVFVGLMIILAAGAFVAPLWGIHNRLVQEKEQLLLDAERRITQVGSEMYARIDAGSFDETKAVDSIAGLTSLRERIVRLPTWPWPPNLFRGFVSALFLPIVVYIVSRAISAGLIPGA